MSFQDKSPEMQEVLNELAVVTFGISVSDAQSRGICVRCKKVKSEGCKTELDLKEWGISGLCGKCWGLIVGPEEE